MGPGAGGRALLQLEFRPVLPVVEAPPEQPLQGIGVGDRVRGREAEPIRQADREGGPQLDAQDRLVLVGGGEAGGQGRAALRLGAVADGDPEAVFVPQRLPGIAKDLGIKLGILRQDAAEGLPEIHVVDGRAHHPFSGEPEPDGAQQAFVAVRVLIHPLEAGPVPVDMVPVFPVQLRQEAADGLVVPGLKPAEDGLLKALFVDDVVA